MSMSAGSPRSENESDPNPLDVTMTGSRPSPELAQGTPEASSEVAPSHISEPAYDPGEAVALSSGTIPREFDGYRLIHPIGKGAMGEVFLAKELVLDREVAIKFVSVLHLGSRAHARFVREARAIARLQHPNVVAVHRAGEVAGRPYLVSELVRGRSLDKVPIPQPAAELLRIATGLAAGLAAAHRRGVLHRDLKPANALLSDDGEVKLCDFGVAKLLDAEAEPPEAPGEASALAATADESHITRPGTLIGTPRYLAPELWRLQPASAQSDLWALGAMLYELAHGKPPYPATRALYDLCEAVLGGPPAPLASVAPDVEARLAAIIDRCLDALPERRPASADELHASLLALIAPASAPAEDREPGPVAPAVTFAGEPPPSRRVRPLLLGGLLVAVAAIAVAVLRADRSPPAAVQLAPAAAPAALVSEGARSEFFVDAAAQGVATGEAHQPYPSITAALAAASRSSAERKTIHVAAGTYDSTRESFPIELREGVSLIGEGAKLTSIVGAGLNEHSAGGTAADDPILVTILVGDPAGRQTIRGLAIHPGSEPGQPWGIYCDQGNAFPPAADDEPARIANLELDQLEVTGFDHAIVVGTSDRPAPSGCNAKITRSLIAGRSAGVFVVGAGAGTGSNSPNQVSAEIGGDSPADGNRFIGSHADGSSSDFYHRATAVHVFDESGPVLIRHNTFSDNDIGIGIGNHEPRWTVVIDDNYFTGMRLAAVRLQGNGMVQSLSNNFFNGTTAGPDSKELTCGESLTRAVALCINGYPHAPGPQIERARGNVFAGNDVGIYVTGSPFVANVPRRFDFGTSADPGNNRFICNSSGPRSPGYDVWLDTGASSATLPFVGNAWDHAPPTRGGARAPDGTDVVVQPGGPLVDLTGSSVHGRACPEPHHL